MISGRPLGFVALIAWLITVSIGVYMLRTWIARGGLRHQRRTGVGVPPAVVFGHAGAALTGLAVWLSYLASNWHPLAWAGAGLVGIAITLGICTVTLWTPYPVLAEEAEDSVPVVTGPGAAPGEPAETFRVTDEMIARLLAEPFPVRRRRRLQLLPLVPACHGFAAIATFMLALLTAASPR
jgi:manganese efflux pump family protein